MTVVGAYSTIMMSKSVKLREKIHEHIDQLDEAVLPNVLKELERVSAQVSAHRRFSQEFWNTLHKVHTRNQDLSGEEALKLATQAVNADRQRY